MMNPKINLHGCNMKCRAKRCDGLIVEGHPAAKEKLCPRCWEEMIALEEMRESLKERKAKKENRRRKGPPEDFLPVYA